MSTDSTPLLIGAGFALPLEAVTETFAILAKRGAGKTNTAVVVVEELLAHGQQAMVVDPVGVWFGLPAPGTGPGLPVVIIGGEHADLPADRLWSLRLIAHELAPAGAEKPSAVDLFGVSRWRPGWSSWAVSVGARCARRRPGRWRVSRSAG